ncbi:MAG: Gfo/Idh/MocA family oxidoreductase [Fimbriimonadales bacterium]
MGRMHANVYRALDTAELAAVVDHRPEKLENFSQEFGVPAYASMAQLFAAEAIDAVDICLPTYLHKVATIEAANAGKHVLCEKPMALSLDDAGEMIAACEGAGVRLMIAHCIRFWPEYALLKTIVDDKRLGELKSINLTRYGEYPHWSSDNWLGDPTKSGGGALDMHIHDTDFAHYLLGTPDEVFSRGTVDEKGVSQIFTTMSFNRKVAHLEGGWNLPAKTPFEMTFRAIFEGGAVIMDGGPMTIYDGGEPQVPEFPKMEAKGGGNISDMGGYYHEIAYFVDCITNGKPFEITTPQTSRESLATTIEEIRQVRERA